MRTHVARISLLLLCCLTAASAYAGAGRYESDLSSHEWMLWRDHDAEWADDPLLLPPVNLDRVPVNPPTCGWDRLPAMTELTTTLPATVEQFFWGENGNDGVTAGDWRGVAWWSTTLSIPAACAGQRLFLDFDSVHIRAEVYVNRVLTGYDIIGHTPFSVDITGAALPGEPNEIAVRITDPLGNFSWNDRTALRWGNRDIPASHGFGGITGGVVFRAVDPVHVTDVAVLNTPEPRRVTIEIKAANPLTLPVDAGIIVRIHPEGAPDDTMWERTLSESVPPKGVTLSVSAELPSAELWDLDKPNLYVAEVTLGTRDGAHRDMAAQRFGFRWFCIGERDGDRRLYLNGRRMVILSGMSWGFWPVNGVFPDRELAARDIAVAKAMGITHMNFHRAIGQPILMDLADESGFLCYEEPGGYQCEGADPDNPLWRGWRREKLLRMVRRDRSRPSVVTYNLQNRTPNDITTEDVANMRAAHLLDPSRILTFISGFWERLPYGEPHRHKLVFEPYDDTEHYSGWWDMHLFSPAQSFHDDFYNGPEDYARFTDNTSEIMYYGEDGAINNPPRLGLIKAFHDSTGDRRGWQVGALLDWHDAWDGWLDDSGFRRWFPTVDDLTARIGDVSLYYHGRVLENIRMGNVTDCYTINGWAANQSTNHCAIVDLYRNPVGDPAILARYARPLYVAVKLREKVVPTGSGTIADIFLVNETGIVGRHTLTTTLTGPEGSQLYENSFDVRIEGGETYGQLLVRDISLPPIGSGGYTRLTARLTDSRGTVVAEGGDDLFAVDISPGSFPEHVAVIDTSGTVQRAIERTWGVTLMDFNGAATDPGCIIIGRHPFRNRRHITTLMDRIADGATVVVLADTDAFADLIDAGNDVTESVGYGGRFALGRGNIVAGQHPVLDGLPQGCAFGWEYQCFNMFRGVDRYGLILSGGETVLAGVASPQTGAGNVLTVVPFGRGRIILCTLPMLERLEDDAPNTATAKRLLYNLAAWSVKQQRR